MLERCPACNGAGVPGSFSTADPLLCGTCNGTGWARRRIEWVNSDPCCSKPPELAITYEPAKAPR